MIRVLIADDQPLIRSGLRSILEREPDIEVVAEACDGTTAVASARQSRPDVVLMDIRMPGMDGVTATTRILEHEAHHPATAPPPKIIILTTFELDEYIHAGLKAGASGFILKDTEPLALVQAVRAAHDGDAMLSPSVTRRLISSFVRAPDPSASLPALLTERESRVLRAMAQGLSNAEIGTTVHLSEATVKTHVTSILTKLNVRDRLQAVIAAYESGTVRPGMRDQP
ncbi:MAG: response regulator transcription factor [Actinomycetota bacterium]|nr:response regulator transcription factor [Actinomycetota bacterium]